MSSIKKAPPDWPAEATAQWNNLRTPLQTLHRRNGVFAFREHVVVNWYRGWPSTGMTGEEYIERKRSGMRALNTWEFPR